MIEQPANLPEARSDVVWISGHVGAFEAIGGVPALLVLDNTKVAGVRIPYVQVGPPRETGNAPVHIYGYGGFGISMPPFYNALVGKLWLERGGTCVIAHLRGGGEFSAKSDREA